MGHFSVINKVSQRITDHQSEGKSNIFLYSVVLNIMLLTLDLLINFKCFLDLFASLSFFFLELEIAFFAS